MSRIRTVKPDLFRHEALFEAEASSKLPLRLAFIGLFTAVDREGRFRWRPRQLKLDVLPFDEVDFALVLDALHDGGFITRYESAGEEYGAIPSWSLHQIINNRESESKLPDPAECQTLAYSSTTRQPRVPHACPTRHARQVQATTTPLVHAQGEGEGEGKGNGSETSSPSSAGPTRNPKPTIPCPYDAIVDAYHEALPELPKVTLRDGPTWIDRQKAMREFWGWVLSSRRSGGDRRAETAERALEWIGSYFSRARANDFLMGRVPRSPEHKDWSCDIDFLLSKKGMKQVIEKTKAAA